MTMPPAGAVSAPARPITCANPGTNSADLEQQHEAVSHRSVTFRIRRPVAEAALVEPDAPSEGGILGREPGAQPIEHAFREIDAEELDVARQARSQQPEAAARPAAEVEHAADARGAAADGGVRHDALGGRAVGIRTRAPLALVVPRRTVVEPAVCRTRELRQLPGVDQQRGRREHGREQHDAHAGVGGYL